MVRDVELADAEREVHRVEIFERGREVWEVEREDDQRENEDARLKGSRSIHLPWRAAFAPKALRRASPKLARILIERRREAFSRAIDLVHAGRRNSPSFRLPMR